MPTFSTFNDSLLNATAKLRAESRDLRYKNDPVLWAEEVLGVVLWSKQKEILTSLAINKRTAVKSSHSIGKTYLSAVASCWWVATREDSMVQSTAPTYQQVHSLLWEEIRTMHTLKNLKGEINLKDQWTIPFIKDGRQKPKLVAEGKKPADTNIHGFQGTHRKDGVLAILDEACGIAQTIFTGSEAITTAHMDRILAVGNPDDPNTEFGRIFLENNPEWNLITVSAFDTPNFTGEGEEMKVWAATKDKDRKLVQHVNERDGTDFTNPHMMKVLHILDHTPKPDWVASRERDWGKESPRYLSKVLAVFPLTSIDSLFSPMEIETGRNNIIEPDETAFRVIAVDVARFGSDRTVVALNVGGHVTILKAMNSMDTMEVAATVHKLATDPEIKADQVRVDGIGVGGGVVDRLVALSMAADNPYVVVEMTASSSPPDRAIHRNSRAYWYDSVKYQLRNGLLDIPTNADVYDHTGEEVIKGVGEGELGEWGKQLIREMSMIKYSFPNGIMLVESKEDIRRRGEDSPDFMDAVVMACAPLSYIIDDPMADKRPGQMGLVDVMEEYEIVSPY